VTIGTARTLVKDASSADRASGSPLLHQRFEGAVRDGFAIDSFEGAPRFYGVIVEGSEPGVVVDTSGIDGARVATALAWDPDVLAAELRARPPELVVLAYGTNEAFDNRRAEATGSEVVELVGRVREGAPQAECLVVGPPDAAAPDLTSHPRVAEIDGALRSSAEALGCGFFSLRGAMGGEGGFARFLAESPPLARSDRIHFTPLGYAKLGEALSDELIQAYDRSRP
jgi:lysophospholipase L1-like esterase